MSPAPDGDYLLACLADEDICSLAICAEAAYAVFPMKKEKMQVSQCRLLRMIEQWKGDEGRGPAVFARLKSLHVAEIAKKEKKSEISIERR